MLLSLQKKSPTPGRGWGCVVCGLPADGAMAAVCNACFELHGKRLKAPTIKVTRMVTNVPFKCPLCGAVVNGEHSCSRPDLPTDATKAKIPS